MPYYTLFAAALGQRSDPAVFVYVEQVRSCLELWRTFPGDFLALRRIRPKILDSVLVPCPDAEEDGESHKLCWRNVYGATGALMAMMRQIGRDLSNPLEWGCT